jgi:hypothetical protein
MGHSPHLHAINSFTSSLVKPFTFPILYQQPPSFLAASTSTTLKYCASLRGHLPFLAGVTLSLATFDDACMGTFSKYRLISSLRQVTGSHFEGPRKFDARHRTLAKIVGNPPCCSLFPSCTNSHRPTAVEHLRRHRLSGQLKHRASGHAMSSNTTIMPSTPDTPQRRLQQPTLDLPLKSQLHLRQTKLNGCTRISAGTTHSHHACILCIAQRLANPSDHAQFWHFLRRRCARLVPCTFRTQGIFHESH